MKKIRSIVATTLLVGLIALSVPNSVLADDSSGGTQGGSNSTSTAPPPPPPPSPATSLATLLLKLLNLAT